MGGMRRALTRQSGYGQSKEKTHRNPSFVRKPRKNDRGSEQQSKVASENIHGETLLSHKG